MLPKRFVAVLATALLSLTMAPAAVAVPRDDDRSITRATEDRGRSAVALGKQPAESSSATKPPGKPRNDVIEDVPVNPDDASIPLNLTPYHEIPPKLRELQQSERISVEIIGESVRGRDLHLVVATSPMTDAEWAEWQRLSDLRTDDPAAAAAALEAGGYDDWKSPLVVNNNIHGNEWEGTDASLQVLDELAFSDDATIQRLLDEHVLAFVVTNNPDGRVAGTRRNANGFDLNRDYITQSQPEARAVKTQLLRYDPLTMLDQHGYTGTTLIEPTTGPHGENYEYDLYIRHALRNALAMEEAVLALDEPRASAVDIPYRNFTDGWDDWPPIFTPMYAMYHGAVGHTVEFPLNPRGIPDVAERHERTRINTAVSRATIEANFTWANSNKEELLADQLELFRRGEAGEDARPIDDDLALSLAAGDNAKTFLQTYPRAYVIPAGSSQRSDQAAARLAQFLIDNDVEVHRATRPFRLAGATYSRGSYVVDMHQAKRGLANTILDVGRDVTTNFPTMYDISAWSHGYLWGATVRRIGDGTLDASGLREVTAAAPTGSVPPGRPRFYGLEVSSVADVQAVNHLLGGGSSVARAADGIVVLPGAERAAVREAADRFGVRFVAVTPARARGAVPMAPVRLAASAPADEMFALSRMGFEPTAVTHTGFNDGGYAFGDFDALFVATAGFDPAQLGPEQRVAFEEWLADGGTVVGRGAGGVAFNEAAGLLTVVATEARDDANGLVAVVNDADSPITGDALSSSFVSSPRYFTTVGDGVRVDQHLAGEDFFLAGHWVGQEAAAGQPVVVSGESKGADVTLFATEPLYRAHPEGLHHQVANALW